MSELTTSQIESAALAVLQRAMEKYSEKMHISYEEAFVEFASSNTYKELFDFDSLLWTQGPDYLIDIYEAELRHIQK